MENTELTTSVAVHDADATEVAAEEPTDFSAPVSDTAGGDSELTVTVINNYAWTAVEAALASAKLGTAREVYPDDS